MNNILTSLQLGNNPQRRVYIPSKDIKNYNYIYLFDINREDEIILKLVPQTVSESYKSNISSVSPFGTIRPYYFYGGGESKTISFSIDLHEDLDNVNGSINQLIEKIKNLSRPKFITNGLAQSLREPIIYMQLGNQFAGQGHVNISFNYKKPYDVETGRFKVVNMSITFTYHETYDKIDTSEAFSVEYKDYDSRAQLLANKITDLNKGIKNKHMENLLGLGVDYQELGKYIFNNEKIKKVFNIAVQSLKSTGEEKKEERKLLELEAIRSSIVSGHSVNTDEIVEAEVLRYSYNPHALALYNLYIELVVLMNPNNILRIGENAVISELYDLLTKLDKARKNFEIPRDNIYDINNLKDIKMYKNPNRSSGDGTYYITRGYTKSNPNYNTLIYLYPISGYEELFTEFVTKNNLYIDTDGDMYPGLEAQYKFDAERALESLKKQIDNYGKGSYWNSAYFGWYSMDGLYYMADVSESQDIMTGYMILRDLIQLQINTRTHLYGAGG